MLKNLLYSLAYFFISILMGNVIITIFNYFNIISNNFLNIINFIFPILLIIVNGYILGKKTNKKGFLEGLKFGGIVCIVFFILTIISNNFNLKIIIYYTILIICSILSSTLGINKKIREV